MKIAQLSENTNQRYIVYSTNDVSPTIQAVAGTGGGNAPYVIVKQKLKKTEKLHFIPYDEQNRTVRIGTVGTLTTDGSSPKHNNRIIEVRHKERK